MTQSEEQRPLPRNADSWAKNVGRLEVGADQAQEGYNIQGRRVTGPQQGFGRLWQRTYTTDLGDAVTSKELVATWKQNFGSYWPKAGTFYGGLTGVAPGDVAPIAVNTGAGLKLATGILVLYADDESFTFMTPEGHMFAGMITFEGADTESGTQAQIKILIRASDPLYELGWPVMKRKEDQFWGATLQNLAASYGVHEAKVTEVTSCVDRSRLWSNWRNVRHNAGIRSALHALSAPVRAVRRGAH